MLGLILGIVGILMGLLGIFINLYVLLVLVFHKKSVRTCSFQTTRTTMPQTRSSSEIILLHLSSCGLTASFCNLFFSGPSIISGSWTWTTVPVCDVVGASILIIQLLTVWSICALSADRCTAIMSPLRYTQVVTRKRIAIYFVTVWIISLGTVLLAFFFSALHDSSNLEAGILLESTEPRHPVPIKVPVNKNSAELVASSFMTDSYESEASRSYLQPVEVYLMPEAAVTVEDRVRNFTEMEMDDVLIYPAAESGTNGLSRYVSDTLVFEFRPALGFCFPKVYRVTWVSLFWTSEWVVFILVAPMATLLVCDLIVLSIARRQRHRIVMALYQITLSAQATVTRSKGTAPPSLWLNQTVPAKSRACRAVWEDLICLVFLNSPLILILVLETLSEIHAAPEPLMYAGTASLFLAPTCHALLYGVRARPLQTAVRSYLRKRMTNSTLQHEIQQRLSPVDGSPRASSRAKSFRSSSPSPNSSPFETPRRLSTNDLRPPRIHLSLSPSHDHLGRPHKLETSVIVRTRKSRSFLHLPSQQEMHEFWTGLRRPNRSPTIVITHEIRLENSQNSLFGSSSSQLNNNAEHML